MTPDEFVDLVRSLLRMHDCEGPREVKRGKRNVTIDHTDAWNAMAVVTEIQRVIREVEA